MWDVLAYGWEWWQNCVMLIHTSAMRSTLTALRTRHSEVTAELVGLEQRVATLSAEDEDLQAAIVALQRLVGEEGAAGDVPDADASDEVVPPPQRKKVRSTQMVKDYLQFVGRPQTRQEILGYFQAQGIAANWKNPVNAVNTAVVRALETGEVRLNRDGRVVHVSALTTNSPSSPMSGAPSHTEEQ